MPTALLSRSEEREFSFSDEQFKSLTKIANQHTGIMLPNHKKDMIYSRLVRRIRALELDGFDAYCELMQGDAAGDEIMNMVNAVTTNFTSFFREGHHFEHLRDNVLAPLVANPPTNKRLRIWSAGCSAGMEAYSIAMTMKGAIKNLNSWDAKILATDIDTNILDTGIKAEYPIEQFDNIPAAYRSDVTQNKKGDLIKIADNLRSMVTFNHLNLLDNWPMKGSFDVVFCRNVVIYFDKQTQIKLFDRIADLIKPDGFLYIGHSETLFKISDRFESIGRTIYRKVK